jgi:hypothetical protein
VDSGRQSLAIALDAGSQMTKSVSGVPNVVQPNALVAKALELAAMGRSVLPSTGDKQAPVGSWKRWQTERPSADLIRNWGLSNPDRWGFVCGSISGVVVADFDGDAGRELLNQFGLRPHVRSGSGGFHVHLKHPGWRVPTMNAKSSTNAWPWRGLDIRGDGGFIVALGRNENGPYQQLRPFQDIDEFDVLPAAVRRFLQGDRATCPGRNATPIPTDTRRVDPERLIRKALEGADRDGRNNCGFWLAVQLRDNGYRIGEAESAMRIYRSRVPGTNAKGERELYTEHEMKSSLREAYSRLARMPWAQKQPSATAMAGRHAIKA